MLLYAKFWYCFTSDPYSCTWAFCQCWEYSWLIQCGSQIFFGNTTHILVMQLLSVGGTRQLVEAFYAPAFLMEWDITFCSSEAHYLKCLRCSCMFHLRMQKIQSDIKNYQLTIILDISVIACLCIKYLRRQRGLSSVKDYSSFHFRCAKLSF